MKSFGFDEQILVFEDSIGEVEANAFERGQPCLDCQEVVVAGGRFVTQPAFDYGEDGILVLPLEKTSSELAKEFSASGFEDVEVARVIDMIADSTLGIGDAMGVLMDHWREGACNLSSKFEIRNSKQIRILKFEVATEEFNHGWTLINTDLREANSDKARAGKRNKS